MKTQDNEMLIYFQPDSSVGKKTLAYAQTLVKHVRSFSMEKNPLTPTLMKSLLYKLEVDPKSILNKADPYYQANIRGRDFTMESWLNILVNNPQLIKAPIVFWGEKAMLVENPTDIYGLLREKQV